MLVIGHSRPVKLIKLRNGFCALMRLYLIEDKARRTVAEKIFHVCTVSMFTNPQPSVVSSLSKVSKSHAVHSNAENVTGHKLLVGTVYTTEEPLCGMCRADDIFVLFC